MKCSRFTVGCLFLMVFLGSCQLFQAPETKVPATGITLHKATTSLLITGTETLVASVTPTNASNQGLAWTSSDATVATVTASSEVGLVTAVGVGRATIKATSKDGGYSKECVVTVTLTAVAVTGLSLDKISLELVFPGADSAALVVTVTPSDDTGF